MTLTLTKPEIVACPKCGFHGNLFDFWYGKDFIYCPECEQTFGHFIEDSDNE